MNRLITLEEQGLSTILAALRYYQEKGMGEPENRSDRIHQVATNGDTVISLDDEGIDELCASLNHQFAHGVEIDIKGPEGFTIHPEPFTSITAAVRAAASFPLRFMDRGYYLTGDQERIPITVIPGTMTVDVYLPDLEEANACRTCGEDYTPGGDGWNGECPSCADKAFGGDED